MQSRRNFFKQGAALVAGGLMVPSLFSACAGAGKKHIGLQLYSLRDTIKEIGIRPTLDLVSKMGFTHLETAGYNDGLIYDMDPSEFKKVCEDLGMKVTSAHLGQSYDEAKKDEIMAWWDKATEAHAKLGVKYMIQPWMPKNDETTLEDVKRYCDYFNGVAILTAGKSIAFGYHNHAFEFDKIGEEVILDYMMANTSPNHVFFELDVYWTMKGGQNPVEYINKYADRIKVLHIKDEKEIGASGELDFSTIFDAATKNNIKDWYVEVERYTNNNPVESVQQSFDFLNKAPYVI